MVLGMLANNEALRLKKSSDTYTKLKFAPAIRRKLGLLNRLDRKSLPKSVHVDIHKSANL